MNQKPDEVIQVNLRLERQLVAELDRAARTEEGDRTELARRLLRQGLARLKVDRAVREYAAGRVSASKAAEDAGISLYEMLDKIHEAGIRYELDPLTLERIDAFLAASNGGETRSRARRVSESGPRWDAEPGIAELRERYRPRKVRVLFVGESSPAGGTHFYRANSNLFRATREAFAEALGTQAVPEGDAFLRFFADGGCWLVDLAAVPVNRLPGVERRTQVKAGVEQMAELIRETRPERIIAVKSSIEGPVLEATRLAGFDPAAIDVLPFPVRQWRRPYVRELAILVRATIGGGRVPDKPSRTRRRT